MGAGPPTTTTEVRAHRPSELRPLGLPFLRATVVLAVMTAIVTWPQVLHLNDAVFAHHDPFFSMWRLSWIAHALRTDPRHLFDANIFFPELRTLAYSDATMLQGLLAAPFLWAGSSQVLVYNVLLMIGMLTSGLGMFVLTRYLTRNDDAALVAAVVFTLVPYRIEHLMHLELEWTVWMPLAFWALHRAFHSRSSKAGVWVGMFICLQVLSCVYYGVFLSMVVSLIAILLIASRPAESWRALPGLAAGALIGAVISGIYAVPYRESASIVGSRGLDEIALYSATPLSYLASPYWNWLYGWTAECSVRASCASSPDRCRFPRCDRRDAGTAPAGVDLPGGGAARHGVVVRHERLRLPVAAETRAAAARLSRRGKILGAGLRRAQRPRRVRVRQSQAVAILASHVAADRPHGVARRIRFGTRADATGHRGGA